MAMTPGGAKRADAVQNIERILAAAGVCLTQQPNATMMDIARQAGVGRATLYAHFGTRRDLIDAMVARAIEQSEKTLAAIDLDGDAPEVLARLIGSSWSLMEQSRAVIAAAHAELDTVRLRDLHDAPAERVHALIERGRAQGSFRSDMPTSWLVAIVHQMLNAAADEIAAGRLDPSQAPHLITTTVLTALNPGPTSEPGLAQESGQQGG